MREPSEKQDVVEKIEEVESKTLTTPWTHCEFGKELRLQGEAALQTPSFRDAEPHLVIPPKTKKNHGVPPMQIRPEKHICLTTTNPCLPIIAWKCKNSYCS